MDGKRPEFGNISSFLDRFKKFKTNDGAVRKVVADVLNDKFSLDLLKADVSIKNGVAFINCSPLIKQEIFIYKEALLIEMRGKLSEDSLKDLR